jgi:type I restriction enzyme S subunit
MNYIEKLLQGKEVQWKKLGEVTNWDKRFHGVDTQLQKFVINFEHVSAAKLKSLKVNNGNIKLLSTGNFEGYTTEELGGNYINYGEVITIPTGGTANLKYYHGMFIDSGNLLGCSSNKNNYYLKYIYHYLLSINNIIQNYFRGSGVKHPSMVEILNLPIPIPPISVQKEIVRILDTFTKLTAELTAELTARKKQYQYYRENLLTPIQMENGEWKMNHKNIEWKTLGEVGQFVRGKRLIKSQLVERGKYAVFQNSMTPLGYYHKSNVQADTTFIISAGSAGEIGYSNHDFWAADDVYYFVTPENFKSKFLYYFLLTQQNKIYGQVRKGSVPRLSKTVFEKMVIPIPTIEEQERIVSILDTFDTLTNSISQGLPKEIELRKKQYEYYREQLLTF